MLLVLDNVEHVMAATLPLSTLLDACPMLQVLATSRESLRLRREHTWEVEPLAVPRLDRPISIEALADVPSVALFVERARAVEPSFVLNAESADAVAELCTRLDGLPLAIELAAARTRVLSPRALLGRLVSRPDHPPSDRHRTLWSTINWSYELLLDEERALFRQLGVFAGAWSLESVESVCANLFYSADPVEALDRLSVLVDKSLVRPDPGQHGEPVFRLLETLRGFALEQLHACGEYRATADRHAAYYVVLSEAADLQLIGPQQQTWLARLQREHDNLRAALRWATESGDVTTALRLGGALWRFWWLRGHLHEGLHWLRQALAMPGDAPIAARARALHAAGKLARERGDPTAAEAYCRESLGSSGVWPTSPVRLWCSTRSATSKVIEGTMSRRARCTRRASRSGEPWAIRRAPRSRCTTWPHWLARGATSSRQRRWDTKA
jgi:predicted ATPase